MPKEAKSEREVVVAWLRGRENRAGLNHLKRWNIFSKRWWWIAIAYGCAADAIERAEHLPKESGHG